MMTGEQPARLPNDPGVSVQRYGEEYILVTVGDQGIKLSRFNAWRVFGMLAVMLGIQLPKALSKRIRM